MKDSEDPSENEENLEEELLDIIKEEESIGYVKSMDICLKTAYN